MVDHSVIMCIIRPQFGKMLRGFLALGFGTWEEFVDAEDLRVTEEEDTETQ